MRCIMLGAITRKHHKCHMPIGSYMYAFIRQYNPFWQISYSIRLVSKVTIYPLSLTLHTFCGRWWSVLFPLHWNSKVFGKVVISLWVRCLYGVCFWIEYKSWISCTFIPKASDFLWFWSYTKQCACVKKKRGKGGITKGRNISAISISWGSQIRNSKALYACKPRYSNL